MLAAMMRYIDPKCSGSKLYIARIFVVKEIDVVSRADSAVDQDHVED